MRTASSEIQHAAEIAVAVACREVGLAVRSDGRLDGIVATGRGGQLHEFRVLGRAVASTLPQAWLRHGPGGTLVVVADVVTDTAREQLRAVGAGWLDRRGHLHLPALYDGSIAACPRPTASRSRSALSGRGAIEVAVAALLGVDAGVRALARSVGLAPSTISAAATELRERLLLTSDGRPVLPDLFDELVSAWQPDWIPLAGDPSGGLREVETVVAGDVAAAMRGAPVVVSTATPPRYYVQARKDVEVVVDVLGSAPAMDASAWVAVCPSRVALSTAEELRGSTVPWIAGRVMPARVCALELAGDPGRGREVLDAWDLSEAPWRP